MSSLCVAFDCDGVLLDSNAMKTQGFASVLSAYPADKTEAFLAFQRTAFGMSRYRLVDAFFADYLGRPAQAGEREGILETFGRYCTEHYVRQPFTDGVLDVLGRLADQNVPLFVVSGSDQEELRGVLAARGIASFFRDILGSPVSKADNLAQVLASCPADRYVFVGDAKADYLAASAHACEFYYLSSWAADPDGMAGLKAQHHFTEITRLPQLLDRLALSGSVAQPADDLSAHRPEMLPPGETPDPRRLKHARPV